VLLVVAGLHAAVAAAEQTPRHASTTAAQSAMQLVSPAQPPRSRRLAQLLQIVKRQQEADLAGPHAAEQPAAEAPVADSSVAEEVPKPKAYQPPRKDNGIGGRVAQVCVSETVRGQQRVCWPCVRRFAT
jgi:hypothetical protein